MRYSIYLVEDEEDLNLLLKSYLEKEGWEVTSFLTGGEAEAVIEDRPHLWILDIMLPGIDGYQLLAKIKERYPDLPVIFISARDSDLDKIIGLERGSDDYLAKPFSPRELVIRARKLLERVYSPQDRHEQVFLYDVYKIDPAKRAVFTEDDLEIELTSKEFDLLLYLLENIQLSLAREQILTAVWGIDYFGTDRVLDVLIRRLRKKLPGLRIETIYGYGYRLVKS
ncbi:MAG TPA: response regulator transcription factor [Firmicutes bacterium]|jgi:two-component system response regulator CssR|nr:response regulator transcription factor [Bacillota bacterium]